MIAVADTSPLCYLVRLDEIELLHALFGRVLIPEAVAEELAHPGAGSAVRSWMAAPPPWLEIRSAPSTGDQDLDRLEVGEREAISLALELSAEWILLDERKARSMARSRGLRVVGLLGVLQWAARRELVDLPDAIARLRRTNFRVSPKLLREILRADGQSSSHASD